MKHPEQENPGTRGRLVVTKEGKEKLGETVNHTGLLEGDEHEPDRHAGYTL